MKIRDIMTTDIEFIRVTDTVRQAAEKMRHYDIGVMPVSDNGEIVGIITDRDIVVRGVADGAEPMMVKVGRVMSPMLISCSEDTDAVDAVELMMTHRIHRIIVKNAEGRMAGIVTLSDLAPMLPSDVVGRLVMGIYRRRIPSSSAQPA